MNLGFVHETEIQKQTFWLAFPIAPRLEGIRHKQPIVASRILETVLGYYTSHGLSCLDDRMHGQRAVN